MAELQRLPEGAVVAAAVATQICCLVVAKTAKLAQPRMIAVENWCAMVSSARKVKQRRETGNRAKTPLNAFR
jgi:hypothetical protein